MVFLNPLFLWALLGISIPIAIHFWSKKKVKTIKIGSTQFLKELNPKQTSSIRLNQWFLLLLRIMILGLIALILAMPRLELLKTERSITYLVEPSLLTLEKVQTLLDTVADDQIRLLQSGFPLTDESEENSQSTLAPNYWQLTQEMKNLQADSIIVLSKGLVQGFKGMRPSVNLPLHWLVLDSVTSTLTPVRVIQNKDQFIITSLKSDQSILQYQNEISTLNDDVLKIENEEDSVELNYNNETIKLSLTQQKTSRILIVSEPQFDAEEIYISSAFNALSKYLDQDIQVSNARDVEEIDMSSFDVLVWLKQEAMIPFNGKKLQWQTDDLATNLIETGSMPDHFFLTHHLDAENSVDMNLPFQLSSLLDFGHQSIEDIESLDMRTMDLQEIQVNMNRAQTIEKPKQLKDISVWLWTILLVILPVERILSKYKKQ